MKRLKYIYTLLVAILLGFFSFACSDDDVEQTEAEKPAEEYSGEPITTTVKVCVSAPDVSVDVDTRAGGDKANIEYEQPENGGRFQNIVVVVTDNSDKVYAIHCNKWYNNSNPTSAGMKQYEVIFPDLKINDTRGKVYALGNVSTDVYETISGYTVSGTTALSTTYMPEVYNLIKTTTTISADEANLHKLSFTPKKGNFKVGEQPVTTTCSGMPVNAMATATIQKGATIFNVHMKRVCARLQVTFRNFTGQYIDYDSGESKDNNVYVDNFVLKKVLLNSSKYFYNGSAPSTAGSVDFNILKVLGGTNNHNINKIENGKEITVSMYVFENKKGNTSGAYTYDLKVDRGKSLGNQVENLENGNVYVMWSDNLDSGSSYANSVNRCLGADDSNIKLVTMNSPDIIPYGTGTYGNRVFWQYNGGKFQSCKVDLQTDACTTTGKYINDGNYKKLNTSGTSYGPSYETFAGFNRFRLSVGWGYYLMISNDALKSRFFLLFEKEKPYYPWVFFAKYIMRTGVALKGNGSNITQIERNHSYELDFSVMPNYDTKQELLVKCVRKQNDVDWSETQK
ncbi:MAG: hypothetical protein UE068_13950 [Paludibacteraceae bacterium]|nr:hypothetical protein [Paludibacteraceae bacterium]